MEKVALYQQIIIALFEEYIADWGKAAYPREYQLIADEKRHHYQLVCLGWNKHRYTHFTVFHFDIINEKVWIQENRTDILVGKDLIARGIPRTDIVLGLQAPNMRQYTDYASA